jgi:hypothetical protein
LSAPSPTRNPENPMNVAKTYLSPESTAFLKAVVADTLAQRAERRRQAAQVAVAFDRAATMDDRLAMAFDKADRARFSDTAAFGTSAYGELA